MDREHKFGKPYIVQYIQYCKVYDLFFMKYLDNSSQAIFLSVCLKKKIRFDEQCCLPGQFAGVLWKSGDHRSQLCRRVDTRVRCWVRRAHTGLSRWIIMRRMITNYVTPLVLRALPSCRHYCESRYLDMSRTGLRL